MQYGRVVIFIIQCKYHRTSCFINCSLHLKGAHGSHGQLLTGRQWLLSTQEKLATSSVEHVWAQFFINIWSGGHNWLGLWYFLIRSSWSWWDILMIFQFSINSTHVLVTEPRIVAVLIWNRLLIQSLIIIKSTTIVNHRQKYGHMVIHNKFIKSCSSNTSSKAFTCTSTCISTNLHGYIMCLHT